MFALVSTFPQKIILLLFFSALFEIYCFGCYLKNDIEFFTISKLTPVFSNPSQCSDSLLIILCQLFHLNLPFIICDEKFWSEIEFLHYLLSFSYLGLLKIPFFYNLKVSCFHLQWHIYSVNNKFLNTKNRWNSKIVNRNKQIPYLEKSNFNDTLASSDIVYKRSFSQENLKQSFQHLLFKKWRYS